MVWSYRVRNISSGEKCQTFCTFLVGTMVYSSDRSQPIVKSLTDNSEKFDDK